MAIPLLCLKRAVKAMVTLGKVVENALPLGEGFALRHLMCNFKYKYTHMHTHDQKA